MMIATVTAGNRSVGMLSFSGNTLRRRSVAASAGGRDRSHAGPLLRHVLVGVVAGAHERAGGDVVEAQVVGRPLERGELVGVPVAHDGQVALGGAQVLADGEDLHAVRAQLREGVDHLVVRLAEPDHQAGLGGDLVAAHLLGVGEDAQRPLPARAAAGDRVQPRDDLDVVVEDVGALGDHLGQRHLVPLEVGREHLDLAAGRLAADLADDADERAGALVGQVVAVDAGDDRMAQAHARDRARHARRLERVVPRGLAGLDVAEPAAPRARVAEDHERRGAALPALADVRAGGLLADGVEVLGLDQARELEVALATRRRHLEPGRLALADRPDVGPEDLQDVHPARIGARARAHATEATAEIAASSRLGETNRWRMPWASAKRHAIRRRKHRSGSPLRCPSRMSDVMRTPSSPHGTTHSNGCRSFWTLTAKPWVVTPLETCTPIDAILRSSAQTPVKSAPSSVRTRTSTCSSASAVTIARSIVRTNAMTSSVRMIG